MPSLRHRRSPMNIRKVFAMATHLEKIAKYSPSPWNGEILKVSRSLRVALNQYQKYFQEKLKEHGKSSIKEMTTEEKKEFFSDVNKGWKAQDE